MPPRPEPLNAGLTIARLQSAGGRALGPSAEETAGPAMPSGKEGPELCDETAFPEIRQEAGPSEDSQQRATSESCKLFRESPEGIGAPAEEHAGRTPTDPTVEEPAEDEEVPVPQADLAPTAAAAGSPVKSSKQDAQVNSQQSPAPADATKPAPATENTDKNTASVADAPAIDGDKCIVPNDTLANGSQPS